MKLICLLLLFISSSAFACWKAEGSFAVDGEKFRFNQRIDHKKEYKIPGGKFILTFTISPEDKNLSRIKYKIEEKKGTTLTLVTDGEDELQDKIKTDIFAKGKENQPNSIITFKLTDI